MMNRLTAILLFLPGLILSESRAADHETREQSFARSLELFDNAKTASDYRESAQVMESMLTDGFSNGAVYYNLGNAYFRGGEYGKAILNYRKAKPYRPRDPYLVANLDQALTAAPGRLAEVPRPWWMHVLFWTELISFPTKVKLSFGLSTLTALAVVAAAGFRVRRLTLPIFVFTLAAVAIGIDTTLSSEQVTKSQYAVITGETVARKGTGTSYEAAFDQPLRDGAEFRVLTETHDWTLGRFERIGDGWIRNEFVAR